MLFRALCLYFIFYYLNITWILFYFYFEYYTFFYLFYITFYFI